MASRKQTRPMMDARKLRDLSAAKKEWSTRLLMAPPRRIDAAHAARNATLASRALVRAVAPDPSENVVGIGVGEKVSDGQHTGVWAVKFYVRMKYPERQLEAKYRLPKTIGGLPVDVEETGLFRRFDAPTPNPRTRIRPAPPGSSVGFQDPNNQFVMAGTFGALVSDRAGSYILSNNHVLADEDRLPAGAPIFQPGLLDNGNPSTDQIATLARAITLQGTTANTVDCALAKVTTPSSVTNQILFIGAPKGTADAAIDMTVQKFGRTSSYTVGRVTSIDTDVTVQYETGSYTFSGQIIVQGLNGQAFSAAGDSGSLILERPSNLAVGLLFAGSPSHTIANHITDVLTALKVALA